MSHLLVVVGALASFAAGWFAVDRVLTRPQKRQRCTAHLGYYCHCGTCRRTRSAEIEAGKPLPPSMSDRELKARAPHTRRWRCTQCDAKLRKHVHHPVPGQSLGHDVALCDACLRSRTDQEQWMGFDIIG